MPAHAATPNSSMTVSATVTANCVMRANALNFGNYTGNVNSATSSIQVTCTNGVPYSVILGSGNSGSVLNRTMSNGSNTLPYGLYKDSSHSSNWGQTAGIGDHTGTGSGAAQNITVYGVIKAGITAPVGNYTDTVLVTINY